MRGPRGMHSIALSLEASQFLSGWRAQSGALFLPALSESRVGDEVAARIGIYGQTIRATVFGKVSLVRRVGRPSLPPGIELALDRASIAAARFLAMAARGESVSFRERAPRFAAERRVAVAVPSGPAFETKTVNLSEGGCSIVWQGELPEIGALVNLRIGDGLFAPVARAVVCWNALGGGVERTVGVRIVPQGRGARAWKNLVAEVARSGARAA
ncbi:MAG TPA: PilZ domain-containing protein [Anaeromyxobacteraceae bacterium]|nr:PilZ domain-containing protein [Anaeromyxobacteraceae bacterium]